MTDSKLVLILILCILYFDLITNKSIILNLHPSSFTYIRQYQTFKIKLILYKLENRGGALVELRLVGTLIRYKIDLIPSQLEIDLILLLDSGARSSPICLLFASHVMECYTKIYC